MWPCFISPCQGSVRARARVDSRRCLKAVDLLLRAVVGSSVKSLFNFNKRMPACVLLVGNSPSGQQTANCLASKLAGTFQKAYFRKSVADFVTFDSAQLSGTASRVRAMTLIQNGCPIYHPVHNLFAVDVFKEQAKPLKRCPWRGG